MRKLLQNRWSLLALRLFIGGVFIYAGLIKIDKPLAFADSIATFQVLPPQLINLVALALPLFEILVGGLLIFGIFQRQAAFALTFVTILFVVLLVQALVRGLQVDCGCFGFGAPSPLSTWSSLGRDLFLLTIVTWLWMCSCMESDARGESPS